jgi:hypothetical protein
MNNHTETLLREDLRSIATGQPFTPDISAIERRGRQLRRRAITARGLAGLGVAAAVTAVSVAVGTSQSHPVGHDATSDSATSTSQPAGPALTAKQALLFRLASVSTAIPAPEGRFVVLSETDTETGLAGASERTSVIDTVTGSSTTYQHAVAAGGQAPSSSYTEEPPLLTEGADPTSTEAWYTALPTDPTALRAKLLTVAEQQAQQAAQAVQQQAEKAGKTLPVGEVQQPALSDDDYVYQEADTLLWSPLVQPTLRAALYKVLAGTDGFTITDDVTDPDGRPAIAMTRHYNGVPETDTTYEDPATGAVLAQIWEENGDTITAVYQPVTGSDTVPANPYTSS